MSTATTKLSRDKTPDHFAMAAALLGISRKMRQYRPRTSQAAQIVDMVQGQLVGHGFSQFAAKGQKSSESGGPCFKLSLARQA